MFFFACILLVFTSGSAERPQSNDDPIKRELEHRSNLALLTSINLGEDKSLNTLSPNPETITNTLGPNRNLPIGLNLQETYQIQNSPPIPVPQLTNELAFNYAPAHRYPLVNIPTSSLGNPLSPVNNLVHPYENLPLGTRLNLITNNNLFQSSTPQETPLIPQGYPVPLSQQNNLFQPFVSQETSLGSPVPQQSNLVQPLSPQGTSFVQQSYPAPQQINVVRTVQVPIQVRVPVEVPKPYEVKVPHPVPVPVHIRVPVPVDKPYPVQITKTVAVPVEKPVYIRVPQPVGVPVPQPYPVGVPQPVQIKVPVVVRFSERFGNELINLDGTPFVPSAPVSSQNVQEDIVNIKATPLPSTINTPCSTCNKEVPSTRPPLVVTTSRPPFIGNGLLPPPPPTKLTNGNIKSVIGGLLNSYVASKVGGVYRRSTKYQTAEYHKTW